MITTAKFEKTSATVKKIVGWAISIQAPKKFGEGSTTNHKAYRVVPKLAWTRVRGCFTFMGSETILSGGGNMPRRIVPEVNKETVENAYRVGGSLEGAAKILNVSKKCVLNWMKKFNIPRNADMDMNKVRIMAQTMTAKEIATAFGVTSGHVVERAKVHGIKIIDKYHKGYATTHAGYHMEFRGEGRKSGYKLVHRVVMEEHIGRKLGRNEIVHHVNRDKADNRIENLQLMTRSEHSRLHYRETMPGPHKSKV